MSTLDTEQAWLTLLENSRLVGISLLDESGRLVQRFSDDDELRAAIIEHQRQRVRELALSGTRPVTYQALTD